MMDIPQWSDIVMDDTNGHMVAETSVTDGQMTNDQDITSIFSYGVLTDVTSKSMDHCVMDVTSKSMDDSVTDVTINPMDDGVTDATSKSMDDCVTYVASNLMDDGVTDVISKAMDDSVTDVTSNPMDDGVTDVISKAMDDSVTDVTSNPVDDGVTDVISKAMDDIVTDVTSNPMDDGVTDVISKAMDDSVTDVTSNPMDDGVTDVISKAMDDSVTDVTSNAVDDGVTDVISKAMYDIVTDVTSNPMDDGVTDVIGKAMGDSVTDVTSNPMDDRVTDVTSNPMDDSVTEVTSNPMDDGVTDVISKAMDDSVTDVTSNPMDDSVTDVTSNPMDDSGTDVTSNPMDDGVTDVTSNPMDEGVTDVTSKSMDDGVTDVTSKSMDDGVTDVTSKSMDDGVTDVISKSMDDSVTDVTSKSMDDDVTDVTTQRTDGASDSLSTTSSVDSEQVSTPGVTTHKSNNAMLPEAIVKLTRCNIEAAKKEIKQASLPKKRVLATYDDDIPVIMARRKQKCISPQVTTSFQDSFLSFLQGDKPESLASLTAKNQAPPRYQYETRYVAPKPEPENTEIPSPVTSNKSNKSTRSSTRSTRARSTRGRRPRGRPRRRHSSSDTTSSEPSRKDASSNDASPDEVDSDEDPMWTPEPVSQKKTVVGFISDEIDPSMVTTPRTRGRSRGGAGRARGRPCVNLITTSKTPANATLRFKRGSFVRAIENDALKTLWKVDTGRLLQKFECYISEGESRLLYRGLPTYTSWVGNLSEKYQAVLVKTAYVPGQRDIVEVVEKFEKPTEKPSQVIVTENISADTFDVYLQILISRYLEPAFMEAVHQSADGYYTKPMKQIDDSLQSSKCNLLASHKWQHDILDLLSKFCELRMNPLENTTAATCQLCTCCTERGTQTVSLTGATYDMDTLNVLSENSESTTQQNEFVVCQQSSASIARYHSLQHFKYTVYTKCCNKVNELLENDVKENSQILEKSLQDRDWVFKLFQEFLLLIGQNIDTTTTAVS